MLHPENHTIHAVLSGKSSSVNGVTLLMDFFWRFLFKICSLPVFTLFTNIKTFYRPVISHDPGKHKAFCSFFIVIVQLILRTCRIHIVVGLVDLLTPDHIWDNIHVRRIDNHVQGKC